MAGFCALADFKFSHLDLVARCEPGKILGVERATAVATAEIAGADFPDQVATILLMIRAEAAFAGVMGEVALPGTRIQRTNRVGTKRAKAHRRDIEHRRRIGLCAIRTANGDAELLAGLRLWGDRMVHPFVTLFIDIFLGAE